ncbi:spermidine synthase [Elusimicrobiota bacterium]
MGAALAIMFRKKGITLITSIFILILLCIFSYLALFICFQVNLAMFKGDFFSGNILLKYLIAFILELVLFLPFFMAYGLCEFICYTRLNLSIKKIYIAFLCGCALAFLNIRFFTYPVGVFRYSLFAICGFILIIYILTEKKSFFIRLLLPVTAAGLILSFFNPFLEGDFVSFLQGNFKDRKSNQRIIFQEWNEHCFFRVEKVGDLLGGYYNQNFAWRLPMRKGRLDRNTAQLILKDQLPYRLTGFGRDIAILGSGGGLQVLEALRFKPARIDAIEVIPKVVHLIKGKYAEVFSNIYNHPFVYTHTMDARKFLENTRMKYDLIYMASTDGAFGFGKTLLEMHHTLSTREAFSIMYERLKPQGMLAIRQNNFLRYYFTSLESAGFKVYAYKSASADPDSTKYFYWLIAVKKNVNEAARPIPDSNDEDAFFRKLGYIRLDSIDDYPVKVITDDKPLKGGILLNALPYNFVERLFKGLFLITGIIAVCIFVLLKYFFNSEFPSRKKHFSKISFAAIMVGINFIVMENFLINKLSRYLSVPLDAMYVGIVIFVLCAGIGAYLIGYKYKKMMFFVSVAAVLIAFFFQNTISIPATLILMMVGFIYTGTLFPAIFKGNDSMKVVIFIMDGLGALIGAVISFSLPLLAGFRVFYSTAIIIFIVTAASIMMFEKTVSCLNE